jgi:hypothetical protein
MRCDMPACRALPNPANSARSRRTTESHVTTEHATDMDSHAAGRGQHGFVCRETERVGSSPTSDQTRREGAERGEMLVGLSASELADTLEHLPDDAQITIRVCAKDYRQAREMATGGPLTMTTAVAARVFGWTARRWRVWAETDRVNGAWQETTARGRKRWRLPREACCTLVEELAREGRRAAAREVAERSANASPVSPGRRGKNNNNLNGRSIRRGPRKKKAT